MRICQWQEALKLEKQPRFGPNQALIYSSTSNSDGVANEMNKWLSSHPFILSSLDSKGLEFDDCVIAFDIERNAWAIDSGKVSSLRLLRELNVAITRARRRVVILCKTPEMKIFFTKTLQGCHIEESDANVALYEFDAATTSDEWLARGIELFDVRTSMEILFLLLCNKCPISMFCILIFRMISLKWLQAVSRLQVCCCVHILDGQIFSLIHQFLFVFFR